MTEHHVERLGRQRQRLGTRFFIDHGDFETYRIPGGRTFRIVPHR